MRRTPFVLLVVFLLGSGLIALLLLNSSLNQGSFELTKLQRKTTELTDEQQALQQEVDQLAAPRRACSGAPAEAGPGPRREPAFLNPDGTVHGVPAPAPPAGGTPETDPAAYVPGARAARGRAPGGAEPGRRREPGRPADPRGAAPDRPAGARPPAAGPPRRNRPRTSRTRAGCHPLREACSKPASPQRPAAPRRNGPARAALVNPAVPAAPASGAPVPGSPGR
ncbi:hypothetical protein GCM10020221_19370 [Streptomyces thioluteus]|uniref:Secreted protein n=1 Tax=Streptomyces thioluteus TaxID=66431 RepID=A0ABN3WRZ5_STRTU